MRVSDMSTSGPIAPGLPGCCSYACPPGESTLTHCGAEPMFAGTIAFADGSVWFTFACQDHDALLDEASAVGSDTRFFAELKRRRDGGAAVPVRSGRPQRTEVFDAPASPNRNY